MVASIRRQKSVPAATQIEAALRELLGVRENELLQAKGPCACTACRLHLNHVGPCDIQASDQKSTLKKASIHGSSPLSTVLKVLREDRDILYRLAGSGGMGTMEVAMYQVGLTNHDGSVWVPNPTAVSAGHVLLGRRKEIRLTPGGIEILRQHLKAPEAIATYA